MVEIRFTDDALDDLRRIGRSAVPRVLKKLLILETNVEAGYPLGGELTGFRKLVVGNNTWRIIYHVQDGIVEICDVWAVGERADAEVYDTAVARVRAAAAAATKPHLLPLVEVMERLGKLAAVIDVATSPPIQPVPDWLAERLIYTVGLPREVVGAMDLQQAVDKWAEYTSTPSLELDTTRPALSGREPSGTPPGAAR